MKLARAADRKARAAQGGGLFGPAAQQGDAAAGVDQRRRYQTAHGPWADDYDGKLIHGNAVYKISFARRRARALSASRNTQPNTDAAQAVPNHGGEYENSTKEDPAGTRTPRSK